MQQREPDNQLPAIKLKSLINYPTEALVGKTYLMAIDVQLDEVGTAWPYPEEEYEISLQLNLRPFFSYQSLSGNTPTIILHRFGGTYGPAEFLLTANTAEVDKGTIKVIFRNAAGLTMAHFNLPCQIRQKVETKAEQQQITAMATDLNQVSVFLSYAHEDEVWLKKLVKYLSLLRRQGMIWTWYDRQIVPGTDWSTVIDQRMEQASIILLLVSADFLASDYCYEVEMKRALERHEAGQARVIPIAVRPADWKGAPFAHLQALPTDGRAMATWKDKDEALMDVVAGLRQAIEDLSFAPAIVVRAGLPPLWNIPYPHNSFFLGRDELLEKLHTQLHTGQATALSQSPYALSGLGGIGKTQLATEYAYRYHHDYEAVLWANAEHQEALTASYTQLATLLKLPECDAGEQEVMVEAVKVWLQTQQKWLLILDNADNLDLLPSFLPPALGGHVLITTRAWDMQRMAQRLEVETLSDEQGAVLLLRRAGLLTPESEFAQVPGEDRRWATLLTHELGGLPLALDQAGAYLEATGMSVQDYHELYQVQRQRLLHEHRSRIPDHPEAVATTWSLSFERVQEKHPAAADLLRLCAYFAPDAIAEEILTADAAVLGPVLAPLASDAFQRNQAIEALRAHSLLRRDPREKTISIHRLVQAVLQDAMKESEQQIWAERAMLVINGAFPDAEHATWAQCERLLIQALKATQLIEEYHFTHWEAGRLLFASASYLQARARYAEAQPLYQRALSIWEQSLGPEHPDVASSLNGLANLYREQGKDAEAQPLYQRALSIWEQSLGPEHSLTQQVKKNYRDLLHTMTQAQNETDGT